MREDFPLTLQVRTVILAFVSDVRWHGHAAGNVSTFFNSKSGNCLARRLSAVSVAKNHPKVSDTLIPTKYEI